MLKFQIVQAFTEACMKEKNRLFGNVLIFAGILLLVTVEYLAHSKCVFVMDDLWYGTNLVTGEPLRTLGDVWESQVWHFFNWGGRNITHGILQITLMWGETAANIINLIMMLTLVWLICVISGCKKPLWFLLAASLMISFNANFMDSMFWQSGTVNYVYSSVWILLFLWVYLRETYATESSKLPLVSFWMVPLGLITGWSNENMGPASFLISAAVIVYTYKILKRKPAVWMYLGTAFSLIGSILVVIAPGNFVRTAELPETDLWTSISERFLSMLRAGADYLFPAAALFLLILFVYTAVYEKKLKPFQWFLLAHGVLSYGAMVLSPHYPDRATFGTMCVLIILILSMLNELMPLLKSKKTFVSLLITGSWLYAVYILLLYIA